MTALTPQELVARADALPPGFLDRQQQTEANRRVPQISIDECIRAELYKSQQPARYGGFEHDPDGFAEIAAAVARGDSTALAETDAALARIAAREDKDHAWRYLDADLARANAAAVDAAPAKGARAGAGGGLKDIIDTADMPTENGVDTDKGRQPAEDATVVTRLKSAGAVIIGKTVTAECGSVLRPAACCGAWAM